MAKVKIQGHASGTGILTVTAPNTSTDRTITLPDATGTLATTADVPSSITDNGDATAITIDSDEIVSFSSHVKLVDNGYVVLGAGEDLKMNSDGANGVINAAQGYLALQTGSIERMRVTSDGLTFNGDTAAANALDDYEEGTWTPTLPQGGTITTVNNAVYTKVGNVVSFQLYANNISITNNSSEFQIGGLPFQPMNSPNTYGGGEVGYVGGFNWAQYAPSMLINPSGSKIYWQRLNGTSSPVTQSNLQGLTVIILSGVYHTNS